MILRACLHTPRPQRTSKMPKGPSGEKRPGDVIGAAIMVAKIATGEVEDTQHKPAVAAAKGGAARARSLTASERSAISAKAAKTRWGKEKVVRAQKEPR